MTPAEALIVTPYHADNLSSAPCKVFKSLSLLSLIFIVGEAIGLRLRIGA